MNDLRTVYPWMSALGKSVCLELTYKPIVEETDKKGTLAFASVSEMAEVLKWKCTNDTQMAVRLLFP